MTVDAKEAARRIDHAGRSWRGCVPRSGARWSGSTGWSTGCWWACSPAATSCWRACPDWRRRSPCAASPTRCRSSSGASSHARPAAGGPHRHPHLRRAHLRLHASAGRCSPTWCWPTRSTAPRQGPVGAARGDAGEADHPRDESHRLEEPFLVLATRIRSSRRAPTAPGGAERPLHAQGEVGTRSGRGEGDPAPGRPRGAPGADAAGDARDVIEARSPSPGSTWTTRSRNTSSTSSPPPADQDFGLALED